MFQTVESRYGVGMVSVWCRTFWFVDNPVKNGSYVAIEKILENLASEPETIRRYKEISWDLEVRRHFFLGRSPVF